MRLADLARTIGAALAVVAACGAGAVDATPAYADAAASRCSGTEIVNIFPGLSDPVPTSGRVSNAGTLGTLTCTAATVDGQPVTGRIRTSHQLSYGVGGPSTCAALTLRGTATLDVPTRDGVVRVINNVVGGSTSFTGDRFSGRYTVTPLRGDCVTTPVTTARIDWTGSFN